jgi:hypothetical protein
MSKRDPRDIILFGLGFALIGLLLVWPARWLQEVCAARLNPAPIPATVYVPVYVHTDLTSEQRLGLIWLGNRVSRERSQADALSAYSMATGQVERTLTRP